MPKKVIIMGGGIAGMSAAHELIERGFDVEIYEKSFTHVGGKARSEDATVGPFANLPGEHGFRFFPGFYKHMSDTMKRIPFGAQKVINNLVETDDIMFARDGQEPLIVKARFPFTINGLNIAFTTLSNSSAMTGLSNAEKSFFKEKIFQLVTSSNTRFIDEYEQTGWWYFLEADRFSAVYQNLLADGLTRTMVAAKARTMSTRVGGTIFLQLLYSLADPTSETSRILNGPTNETFLTPWYNHLISQGVVYHKHHEVINLLNAGDQIIGMVARNLATGVNTTVKADYYLLAVPVEKAVPLLNASLRSVDPTLALAANLVPNLSWMNGIQLYLNIDIGISRGHVTHINSPWAVTCISQVQYWTNYDINAATGGAIQGLLSIDISDWDSLYNALPAKNCTEAQLIDFVYEQMQRSLIIGGVPLLPVNRSTIVVGYHIGSSINIVGNVAVNSEPLLVNAVNGWASMPKAWSSVKNLFIAGDYGRTNTNLATMEAANESARRAVNCIIDTYGGPKKYAKVWKLGSFKIFLPYKWFDKKRYDKGIPYSRQFPWWLHVIAFIWAIIWLIGYALRYLWTSIFGPI